MEVTDVPKEMLEQLLCPFQKNFVCFKRIECNGKYCGTIVVQHVNDKGEVIDSRIGL